MDECIFCKIGRKEIAVKAVATNDSAVAFLDINPVSPGHTVVIPKKHSPTILDMNDNDIVSLFSLVREATSKIKAGLNCDGFNIGLNHGPAGGQAIPHIHIHIIPRFKDDKGGSMHTIVRNPPQENIDSIYRKIAGASQEYEEKAEELPELPKLKKEEKNDKKLLRDWELDL